MNCNGINACMMIGYEVQNEVHGQYRSIEYEVRRELLISFL